MRRRTPVKELLDEERPLDSPIRRSTRIAATSTPTVGVSTGGKITTRRSSNNSDSGNQPVSRKILLQETKEVQTPTRNTRSASKSPTTLLIENSHKSTPIVTTRTRRASRSGTDDESNPPSTSAEPATRRITRRNSISNDKTPQLEKIESTEPPKPQRRTVRKRSSSIEPTLEKVVEEKATNMETISENTTEETETNKKVDKDEVIGEMKKLSPFVVMERIKQKVVDVVIEEGDVIVEENSIEFLELQITDNKGSEEKVDETDIEVSNLNLHINDDNNKEGDAKLDSSGSSDKENVKDKLNISESSANKSNLSPSLAKRKSDGDAQTDDSGGNRKRFKSVSPSFDSEDKDKNKTESSMNTSDNVKESVQLLETKVSNEVEKSTPTKNSTAVSEIEISKETKTIKDIDKSPMKTPIPLKEQIELKEKSPIKGNEKSFTDTEQSEKINNPQDEQVDVKKSFKKLNLTPTEVIDLITPMKAPLKSDKNKDVSTINLDETFEMDNSLTSNKSLSDAMKESETKKNDTQENNTEKLTSKKQEDIESQRKAFNDAVSYCDEEEELTDNILSKTVEEKNLHEESTKEIEVEKDTDKTMPSENRESQDLFVSENEKSINKVSEGDVSQDEVFVSDNETPKTDKNLSQGDVFVSETEKSDNETMKTDGNISQDDVFISESEKTDNETIKTDGNVSQDDVIVSETEKSDNETMKTDKNVSKDDSNVSETEKTDNETLKTDRNVSQDVATDSKTPNTDKKISQDKVVSECEKSVCDTTNKIDENTSSKDDLIPKSVGETPKSDDVTDSDVSKDEEKPSNKSLASLKSSSQESLFSSEIDESELAEISQFMKDFTSGLNKTRRSSLKTIKENTSKVSSESKIAQDKDKLELIVENNAASENEETKDINKRRSSLKPVQKDINLEMKETEIVGNKSIDDDKNIKTKTSPVKSVPDSNTSNLISDNNEPAVGKVGDINTLKSMENKKSVSDNNESDEESDDETVHINVETLDDVDTNDDDIKGDDDESSQSDEEKTETINEFIDDMAEEVDEESDNVFENSNDIPDDGESINTTSTERDNDEDSDSYGSDSFIDDEENFELLSGNEDYLKNDNIKIKGKRRKGTVDKKYSRIINTDNLSSDEAEPELAAQGETSNQLTENNKSEEIPTICVDDSESEIGSESTIANETVDQNEINESMNTSVRRNTLKRSSICIQENISIDEAANGNLSERIANVVKMFCDGFKNGNETSGNISLNVSLGFEEEPKDEVFSPNKRKSMEPANVDKNMSPEKIRKVIETEEVEVNVEQISLTPSKSNKNKSDFKEHTDSPTKITPSKKNLDKKEEEFNIDILCPKKNIESPSSKQEKKLKNKKPKDAKEEIKPKKEKISKRINKNETESETISLNENKQKNKKDIESKQTRSKTNLNKKTVEQKLIQKREREIKKPIQDNEPKRKRQKTETIDGWSIRPDKIVPSVTLIPSAMFPKLPKRQNEKATKAKKLKFPYTNVKDESWETKLSSRRDLKPSCNKKTITKSKRAVIVPNISTDSWDMNVISPKEGVSNKMNIVKKKGSKDAGSSNVPSFHPKDFKNQMLHCMGRVDRMDSKILLRSKKAV